MLVYALSLQALVWKWRMLHSLWYIADVHCWSTRLIFPLQVSNKVSFYVYGNQTLDELSVHNSTFIQGYHAISYIDAKSVTAASISSNYFDHVVGYGVYGSSIIANISNNTVRSPSSPKFPKYLTLSSFLSTRATTQSSMNVIQEKLTSILSMVVQVT